MSFNLLKGKKGIIFGALDEKSIAWKTALRAHEEGASIVLTNAPIAMRMGQINELARRCGNAPVIPADATSVEDIQNLYQQARDHFGSGIDFMLHSIGMSPNVRKGKDYGDLNYEWYLKTLDISGISFHKIMQVAEKMDLMNEWGSVIALSYIAAQRTFPGYSDMAQAKAVLESIARSYGYRFGIKKKVRVNTISQSPTITTAGTGINGFDVFFEYSQMMSPLGNATGEDCADYCVVMFSDLTRRITMQNLFNDGGFSASGITEDLVIELMKKKEGKPAAT
ncbi:MAG TPA: SDR family oxidoreductase [Cyclobacteriaceae bacterium]|nr:SDR family oxidoreductase [Cyclobacteriaceae bacterium]